MSTRCQIEFYDAPTGPGEMGEPAARIYQHSDGYSECVLQRLAYLEKLLRQDARMYGSRNDDPEWAAAEYISQFRLPTNFVEPEKWTPQPLHDGTLKNFLQRHRGNIYVTQQLHFDIEYLYRVVVGAKWEIHIFEAHFPNDIPTFKEITENFSKNGKPKAVTA